MTETGAGVGSQYPEQCLRHQQQPDWDRVIKATSAHKHGCRMKFLLLKRRRVNPLGLNGPLVVGSFSQASAVPSKP